MNRKEHTLFYFNKEVDQALRECDEARADVYSCHVGLSKANAQLIAKAPKMHEAIQSAIVEIEDGSPHHARLILIDVIGDLEKGETKEPGGIWGGERVGNEKESVNNPTSYKGD